MAFRNLHEFEQILAETPAAARYIDLHWSLAKTHNDWREIRSRMAGAVHATLKLDPEAAADYALLRDIAAMRAEMCVPLTVYNLIGGAAA